MDLQINSAARRQDRRRMVLDTAVLMIEESGFQGLSLRKLAQKVDSTTQLVYTLFGGKLGLFQELYRDGYRIMTEMFQAAPKSQNSLMYLSTLCWKYREFALNHPVLFSLMFSRPVPEFIPPDVGLLRQQEPVRIMLEAVRTAQRGGMFQGITAEHAVEHLLLTVHGAVQMELGGFYGDQMEASESFGRALRIVANGMNASSPASTRRANS
ncbi:MAG: WHG domain-containing protein [Planctomycetales bacterium]|nr:WHG domain-containing protein [bacterium]UNM09401.1 MAG: WHG domain-containing protein [Planctomycetales bacterium]